MLVSVPERLKEKREVMVAIARVFWLRRVDLIRQGDVKISVIRTRSFAMRTLGTMDFRPEANRGHYVAECLARLP